MKRIKGRKYTALGTRNIINLSYWKIPPSPFPSPGGRGDVWAEVIVMIIAYFNCMQA